MTPDSTTVVTGWRIWNIARGQPLLYSPYRFEHGLWPAGRPLEAVCYHKFPDSKRPVCQQAPNESCRCGIYAVQQYSHELLWHLNASSFVHPLAIGTVDLWGKVVEGERGWRGQYAYPKELYVVDELLPAYLRAGGAQRAKMLNAVYGIPATVESFGQLILRLGWASHVDGLDRVGEHELCEAIELVLNVLRLAFTPSSAYIDHLNHSEIVLAHGELIAEGIAQLAELGVALQL